MVPSGSTRRCRFQATGNAQDACARCYLATPLRSARQQCGLTLPSSRRAYGTRLKSNVGRHKEHVSESRAPQRFSPAVKASGSVRVSIGCAARKRGAHASLQARAARLCSGRQRQSQFVQEQHALLATTVQRPFKLSWCRRWRAGEGKCWSVCGRCRSAKVGALLAAPCRAAAGPVAFNPYFAFPPSVTPNPSFKRTASPPLNSNVRRL